MASLILWMIALPLAGSILNGLIIRTTQPKKAGVIATFFALGSFVCAFTLWSSVTHEGQPFRISYDWLAIGGLELKWGFLFDRLTAVMALVVTGIGTLIHAYSIGYMSHEPTPYRYFAYLNLFLFAMLTLISADNLPVLFVGWEGVGLCSYLLIGYWYQDIDKANAGIKAFIVNRIGDAGFLLGIFTLFGLLKTLNFEAMGSTVVGQASALDPRLIELACFFLFVGAMGKSAQIPLYVWLPDAMAGPTPVSALIHAATMVTAGVYLCVRMNFLFSLAPMTSSFIVAIGLATALLSALIATSQNDIKKVLAYSTVSQLGLMFLAVGCGAYVAAVFHLMTHAFFKALMFLGSGSVIHALEGEQDISKMGGLRKYLPWTFWTFAIGTIAICGIPPLSGFFSKDLILYSAQAVPGNGLLYWVLGSIVSLLTAFYMTRLFVLTFLGEYRGHAHPHESPAVMTIPLLLLAIGSVFAGVFELPHGLPAPEILSHYLHSIVPERGEIHGFISEYSAMAVATVGALLSVSLAMFMFIKPARAEGTLTVLKPARWLFSNKFFVDELYGLIFIKPFEIFSSFLARVFDPRVVDAAVLFPTKVLRAGGTLLSFVQGGSAQFYLLVMTLGALVLMWLALRQTVGF